MHLKWGSFQMEVIPIIEHIVKKYWFLFSTIVLCRPSKCFILGVYIGLGGGVLKYSKVL